ncbi:MAG TPA: nitronate monooxygenase family protein [Vicinamibacterales bacterium]|nr:nitronate monooxygenase family protein [Vicinamibacterales bacterium]
MRDPSVLPRREFLKAGAAATAVAVGGCAVGQSAADGSLPGRGLRTELCDLLGMEYPLLQSGMAPIGGPELAAAVSNAGGLGIIGAAHLEPEEVRRRIQQVRRATSRPFGVNLLLHSEVWPPVDTGSFSDAVVGAVHDVLNRFRQRLNLPPSHARPATRPDHVPGALEVLLEENVPVFSIGLGNPPPDLVARFHAVGTRVIAMVATVEDALTVQASGVDAVVAQGHEAGGHRSTWVKKPTSEHAHIGTIALVPQVAESLTIPVIAAGGISDGRGVAAALALGAQGVMLGTRFAATRESRALDFYKEALVAADSDATTVSDAYSGLYARVLRNTYTTEYRESGAPVLTGYVQGIAARDVILAAADTRNREYYPLWAGQGVGMVHDVPSAGDVLTSIVTETLDVLQKLQIGP